METYKGIQLSYKNIARKNYMSLSDLVQDLTTDCLVTMVPVTERLRDQMIIMSEIEKREELDEETYFDLLEDCNGI